MVLVTCNEIKSFWKIPSETKCINHDDVIKWKKIPFYWPFARKIHRSPVDFPHKSQRRGELTFSLSFAWTKQLSTQSWGGWFETPVRSLWRHCTVIVYLYALFIVPSGLDHTRNLTYLLIHGVKYARILCSQRTPITADIIKIILDTGLLKWKKISSCMAWDCLILSVLLRATINIKLR